MEQAAAVLAKPGFQKAAANLGWLLGERAVRFVLSAGVGFIVARHLGPARLGSLSYTTAVVTLTGGFAGLGLDAVVKRDLLSQPQREAAVLASARGLRFAAGLAAYLLVLALAAPGWLGDPQERRLLAVLGLLLFQPAATIPDLWLQSHLRSKYSVIVRTIGLAVGAAVRLGLVLGDAPLVAFAGAAVVESAVAAAGLQIAGRRAGLRVWWAAAERAEMRRLLAEAWPLIFAGLAVVVYMEIDEIMLRRMTGPAVVGIYSAATRLTEIWYFVPTALASSVLPALLRARGRGPAAYRARFQQYYDANAAVAYLVSVPIALAAPWIVRLAYGAHFAASGPIVAVHIWSSVFVFLGIARGQWLVNEGRQRFYLGATVTGAIVNIALNLVLIPRWAGTGAAIATVVAQATAGWLTSFCAAGTREAGWMQLRALLVPVLGWRYLLRRPTPA